MSKEPGSGGKETMSEARKRCSLEPQFSKSFRTAEKAEWWYYEYIGGIEVYVDVQVIRTACNEGHGYRFKIPRKMLEQSLRRMLASRKNRRPALRVSEKGERGSE